jgi:hypothetical protein
MQDFHPECTINLLIQAQGRPSKYVWACSILTRNSVRLVFARRFLGMVSREQAEWNALLFGLRQAERLQQEKVQLSSSFSLSLGAAGKLRCPELQSLKAQAEGIWNGFRLRKTGKIDPAEEDFLKESAAKAFSRKRKDER